MTEVAARQIADVVLALGAIWLIAEAAVVAVACWLFPKRG